LCTFYTTRHKKATTKMIRKDEQQTRVVLLVSSLPK